eukprot:jgi/Psemu1/25374/gm1.25374_g
MPQNQHQDPHPHNLAEASDRIPSSSDSIRLFMQQQQQQQQPQSHTAPPHAGFQFPGAFQTPGAPVPTNAAVIDMDMDGTTNLNLNTSAALIATSPSPFETPQQRRRRARRNRPPSGGMGRRVGRRQRRLWQLPESKIREYTEYIRGKPEADRTPEEERFLWKSLVRGLAASTNNNNSGSGSGSGTSSNKKANRQKEIVREIVERAEAKTPDERTEHDELFLRLYHKRRTQRRAQRTKKQQQQQSQQQSQQQQPDATEAAISWTRPGSQETNPRGGLEPTASLESLRQSLNKMGLSSDKLKQVRFADPPEREQEHKHDSHGI